MARRSSGLAGTGALALAISLAGCPSEAEPRAGVGVAGGVVRGKAGLTAWTQALRTLEGADAALLAQVRAATTVNLDAPGLTPVAAEAPRAAAAAIERGFLDGRPRSGVVVCASEAGATYSLDGYPPEPIVAPDQREAPVGGWIALAAPRAPGVHSLRVEKPGCFPVETQVVVALETFEVVAVRLAKVVSREAAPGAPARTGGFK